ncbi:MAG: aconitate hydratase [Planctomycetes bacterium]|nr:aconitate hydratase [Planctomycetota bacterium]
MNLARQIIQGHLVEGQMKPGTEIALRIDQTLIQDATGTMVWQQFGSFGLLRVKSRVCTTYVDHNILQTGFQNADDHLYLQSMCARYGGVFSRPGNGISHFAHLERFDVPGDTMLGSDSHTCTAGAMGMLAIGAGGAEVAAAMAGEPFYVKMPKVVRIELTGRLRPWVSAKDVILELLRRLTVKGGVNRIMEYVGPGADRMTVYERATICNMTQELGATSGLFASDEMTRRFLKSQGRENDWKPRGPSPDAEYEEEIAIDLSALEPLVARPHSPDNVVPVREVAGTPIRQVAVGSSVNSGFRDLMIVAHVLKGRHIAPNLHVTLSPGSRQIMLNLLKTGAFQDVIRAGVRALEIACGPCIGMGAAPPTGGHSLRTFNRNFPGRSGTANDAVWLCSPETAAATALAGVLTDPRTLGEPPVIAEPEAYDLYTEGFIPPPANPDSVEIFTGPNIVPPPAPQTLPDHVRGEVLIKLGDNISTDEILPGGNEVLPLRSNIPAIAEYTFAYVDETFPKRAKEKKGGLIVAGENYGQGSSREHAAIAPMYLGVRLVVAKSYARIHEANLVNFGIPPLRFARPADFDAIQAGEALEVGGIREALEKGRPVLMRSSSRNQAFELVHELSRRQVEMLLAGGLTRFLKNKRV